MTLPIPQPEFGVEIEAEEKKIPANENKLILVPETNSFGQNFRPSEGSENCCGCPHPCKCNPCHCEGFAIDPNPVTLVASVAPPVLMMPSEGSKKSIETEGGHPFKTRNDCGRMPTMPMWSYHGSCCQPHDMKK